MTNNIYEKIKQIMEKEDKEKEKEKEKQSTKVNLVSTIDKNKSADDIIKDLKDIEADFNSGELDAPDSLNLKKLDFDEKSDEEIEKDARAEVDSKYNTQKQSTSNKYDESINSQRKSMEESVEKSDINKANINEAYNKSIDSANTDAIKKGLSRSSIIIGEIDRLEDSRAKELSDEMQSLQSKLSSSEEKIAKLESEKEEALNNLDIEYAIELEKKITKAKEDYLKSQEDVIKFNNNVDKLEAEYKLKLEKQKTDKQKEIASLKDKYGVEYYNNLIKDKQYEYLKEYFSQIDKDYALSLLTAKSEFKNILGSRYNQLLSEIKNR